MQKKLFMAKLVQETLQYYNKKRDSYIIRETARPNYFIKMSN